MSGTKSPSPPAPATDSRPGALLIAAHGDCGGSGSNVLASELARRLRLTNQYDEVAIGFLRSSPTIEEAVARIASSRIRLYPLFMSDGYYVREAIPKRLSLRGGVDPLGHVITIDEPLGLDPALPDLLVHAASASARAAGVVPASAALLLVAHGSEKSPHSASAAQQVATAIGATRTFASVEVAFLDQQPRFSETLATCPRPTFVLGFFAGCGLHGDEDLHREVSRLGDPRIHIVERLGGYAAIIELAAASLSRAANA